MIRAVITDGSGQWLLPVLTGFTLDTGLWDGCGSFQVEFPWDLSGCSALEQAQELADQGVKELILVAQETTLYGMDL